MATLNDYKQGSYRSVPFFYRGTSEPGGFDNAIHRYPGSDNIQVEQMRKIEKIFNMDIGIRLEDKGRFDNAISTPGTGILIHPIEGRFLVKLTTFTKDDTVTQLGLLDYRVNFVVEIGLNIPTAQGITLSLINRLRSEALTKVAQNAKDRFVRLGL